MSFAKFLTEAVDNLFTPEDKQPWAQTVFDMLQKSYAAIGGIHGDGFGSPQEMIDEIALWKLVRRGKTITACSMYKDKNGRKRVASGTNGTDQGKNDLAMIVGEDLKLGRAWGEVSENMWRFIKRRVPEATIRKMVLTIPEAQTALKKPLRPAYGEDTSISDNDPFRDFYYIRSIGGKDHVKICLGVPGAPV